MIDSAFLQLSLDINWYFADRYNRICVAASAGGVLPDRIIEKGDSNEEFHRIVMELPERFKSVRNENFLEVIQGIRNQDFEAYFQDFEALASRGLYVFDRINLGVPEDGRYVLVAFPTYNTEKDKFPIDKKNLSLIPKTNRAIISRLNQEVKNASFIPKNLNEIIDNT